MSVSRPLRTLHEDRPPTVHRCGGRGRVRHSRRQPGVTGAARLHDRRLDILSAWGPERNRNSNLFLIIVNGGNGRLGGAKRPMGTAAWRCCGRARGGVANRDDRSFPDTALKGPLTITVFGSSLEETRQWPRLYRLLARRGAKSTDNTRRHDFGEGKYGPT